MECRFYIPVIQVLKVLKNLNLMLSEHPQETMHLDIPYMPQMATF